MRILEITKRLRTMAQDISEQCLTFRRTSFCRLTRPFHGGREIRFGEARYEGEKFQVRDLSFR